MILRDIISATEYMWGGDVQVFDTNIEGIVDTSTARHGGYMVDKTLHPDLAKYGTKTNISNLVAFEEDNEALKVLWVYPELLNNPEKAKEYLTAENVIRYEKDDSFLKNFPEEDFLKKLNNLIEQKNIKETFNCNEVNLKNNVVNFPGITLARLLKDGNVELLKYQNDKGTFYSVDINNKDIGMTLCYTEDVEEAKRIYEKEKFFNKIQRVDDEIVYKINGVASIYGENYNKVILYNDALEAFGRRIDLINYFNNELAHADEYFPDEKHLEDKKYFLDSTNEIIKNLKDSKYQEEVVYIFVHPMDNTFHIADEEEQLEYIEQLYNDIYSEILELTDSEKTEEEDCL